MFFVQPRLHIDQIREDFLVLVLVVVLVLDLALVSPQGSMSPSENQIVGKLGHRDECAFEDEDDDEGRGRFGCGFAALCPLA